MEKNYEKIIEYVVTSGKRVKEKAGKIADIGITKQFQTEEDIAIERGFKELIQSFGDDHVLYGEEENFDLINSDNIWSTDPISGTFSFLRGIPQYSIIISHLYKNEVVFAAIYQPNLNELYTAYKGKGAFLNGRKIHVTDKPDRYPVTAFNFYPPVWINDEGAKKFIKDAYGVIDLYRNGFSCGLNYGYVACGRFDGVVTMGKDIFAEHAGSLLIREAGGTFTTLDDDVTIAPEDRVFIGGSPEVYSQLKKMVDEAFGK